MSMNYECYVKRGVVNKQKVYSPYN